MIVLIMLLTRQPYGIMAKMLNAKDQVHILLYIVVFDGLKNWLCQTQKEECIVSGHFTPATARLRCIFLC